MFFGLKSVFVRTGMVIGLSMVSLAASAFEYFIAVQRTQVFDAAGSENAISDLSRGQMLLRIDHNDGWSRVFFLNSDKQPLKGWIRDSMIIPQGAPKGVSGLEGNHLIVSVETLRVRKGPGSQHPVIGSLKRKQLVKPLATEGEWVKVEYSKPDGSSLVAWTARRYLTSASAFSTDAIGKTAVVEKAIVEPVKAQESASGIPHRVIGNHVRVRKGPGTNYKIAGKLSKNQQVEVLDSKGGWKQIRFSTEGDPMLGWTTEKFLKPLK